jgi:transposase-like protein
MTKISYSGYRFPPEIIQQAIWLYVRFDVLVQTRRNKSLLERFLPFYGRHTEDLADERHRNLGIGF